MLARSRPPTGSYSNTRSTSLRWKWFARANSRVAFWRRTTDPCWDFCPFGGETVYGGGTNPIGLKLNLSPRRQWQPFAALSCGLVATTRPIPTDEPGIDQFNFTAEGQLGIERFNSSRTRAWRVGYKFQHISNGGLGRANPGLNLNLLFFGYSFFR